jgi:hypothetical protein
MCQGISQTPTQQLVYLGGFLSSLFASIFNHILNVYLQENAHDAINTSLQNWPQWF